jgi:hypothetical protein
VLVEDDMKASKLNFENVWTNFDILEISHYY